MSQTLVDVPEIGKLIVSKRRGAKHIRLSINARGEVKVSIPTWLPYSAGVRFAKTKKTWIAEHSSKISKVVLRDGDLIGKYHRIKLAPAVSGKAVSTRLSGTEIIVSTDLPFNNDIVQSKVVLAAQRALIAQSKTLLPTRLAELSSKHNLNYNSLQIVKLTSRWGSCNSDKTIKLSYFLVQLPWHLIDYVLAHELTHTVHLNHSSLFWADLVAMYPSAFSARKELKRYQPIVQPG